MTISIASKPITTTLVVGASGATGRHVVAQLLEKEQNVRVIVRSKERLLSSLDGIFGSCLTHDKLEIVEVPILDLTESDLQKHVTGCDAVVQCLGHNMNFKGIYGKPRRLVTDSVQRLTSAINTVSSNAKFILMGSDGVANPAGTDDIRPFTERLLLTIIRTLLPPHSDNEAAALYLHDNIGQKLPWTIVRPTDLIDADVSKYTVYDKPKGGLFGSSVATRASVATFMVDMILNESKFDDYKYKMPVLHDIVSEIDESK